MTQEEARDIEIQKFENLFAPFGAPSRYDFREMMKKIYRLGFEHGFELSQESERKFPRNK